MATHFGSSIKSPKKRLPSAEGTSFESDDNLSNFDFPSHGESSVSYEDRPLLIRAWYSLKDTFGKGDLAGFQVIWLVVSFSFIICKLFALQIFDNVEWWTIFVLPLLNTVLTGIFDFLMMKYNNPNHVESLIRTRFMILFACKLIIAVWVFRAWLFARNRGFVDRYSGKESWQSDFCLCQVYCIFISCILALIVTELIITTNIINSEQNLYTETPSEIRIILLLIRPVVWVYNRAMIMFLSFYVFYGTIYILLFGIGAICDHQCKNPNCRDDLQIIGVQFLLIPFSQPHYLWIVEEAWQPIQQYENDVLTERIALTFLVTSFWFDCFNGIVQFTKRFICTRIFPKYCALETPETRISTEHHIQHQSSVHSMHTSQSLHNMSNENIPTRDNSAVDLSKNSGNGSVGPSTIISPSIPVVDPSVGGQSSAGGSSGNLNQSMVLKDAASEGYGTYSARIAQAKQRRIESGRNLDYNNEFGPIGSRGNINNININGLLTKATSLSNIQDDHAEDMYNMDTPIGSGSVTNGTNGQATIAAISVLERINHNGNNNNNNNNNKLSAQNIFMDGKSRSISDRSVPAMIDSASGGSIDNNSIGNRNNSIKQRKNTLKKEETPMDRYRKARANSGKHIDSNYGFKESVSVTGTVTNTNNNNNGVMRMQNGASVTATSVTQQGRKINDNKRNRSNSSESSVDTDDDYHLPPAPVMDDKDDRDRDREDRGRGMRRNKSRKKKKGESFDNNTQVIGSSKVNMFNDVISGHDVENMNKYEKYAYKRTQKKGRRTSGWKD